MINSTSRLRVVLVGAGYVAKHHLAALRRLPFVDVVGIADLDLAAAEKLARDHHVPGAARTLTELAGQSPDAVYVLTPPQSHCAIALEALDMNCHVLVEKPMAETVEECDAMIARANERHRVLSVNHSDRLDPVVLQALDLVRSGKCGKVITVDFMRSSEYPPYAGGPLPAALKQGSYPFRDLGVHGLYLLEAFLGPIGHLSVGYRATGSDLNLRFDEWHAVAQCERGIGRLQLSWNVRPMQNRLIIQCARGVIEVDRFLQIVRVQRTLPGPKFIGIVITSFVNALKDTLRIPWNVMRFALGRIRPSPGIQRGAADFAIAIHQGNRPPVSPQEGRHIVDMMMNEAVRQADIERTRELEERFAPLRPASILITGATGFVGSALVKRLLQEGKTVRILARRVPAALRDDPQIDVVTGDLGEPRIVEHAVSGVRYVYHLGAAMKGGPKEFEAGTTWGTRNVIDACIKHAVERLVYVSSLSVLDHAGRDPSRKLTEDSALEPHPERRGAYTQTKLNAEQAVLGAIRTRGLRAVIVRPGQIFGPGAENVVPNATVRIGGYWVAVGPGSQTLPLVYLDDVVDALLLAQSRQGVEGRVLNVVDPGTITHAEYLTWRERGRAPKPRTVRVPRVVFLAIAACIELLGMLLRRKVPLTRYRVQSLRPLANFDLAAATSSLGWAPRVGLSEGMRRTFGEVPR